ncbi:MAG: archaemetzincin family Zn-dependent metalloprotease [Candidatus Hadarchaeales archaeon]
MAYVLFHPVKLELVLDGRTKAFDIARLQRALMEAFSGFFDGVLSRISDITEGTYNPARGQHDAEMILARLLSETGKGKIALGVVGVDIYVRGLNFVFGLSRPSGRAALISTFRLSPEFYGCAPDGRKFEERLIKEAIHELGHVFGLRHCPDRRCVMRFSNSIMEVDEKSHEFCARCRRALRR